MHRGSRSQMFFKIGVLKYRYLQTFSCEYCKIFKNNYFDRTPPVAASEYISQAKSNVAIQTLKITKNKRLMSMKNGVKSFFQYSKLDLRPEVGR